MPHEWHGAGACSQWMNAYDANARKNGITDGMVTLLTVAATRAGVILGTAAYMSPEQARGHAADIWRLSGD